LGFSAVLTLLVFMLCVSGVSAANFDSSSTSSDIQNFIDSTDNDFVINFTLGTENSNLKDLNITKNMTIIGNGAILSSDNGGTLFYVSSPNVKIFNLTIIGYDTAINSSSKNVQIVGNNISTNKMSIIFEGEDSTGILIENNTIISGWHGVFLMPLLETSHVDITFNNNNITSTSNDAVFLASSFGNVILNFYNNNISGANGGVQIGLFQCNNIINFINNNITGTNEHGVYLYTDESNNTITFTNNKIISLDYYGIWFTIIECSSIINFTNNIISGAPGVYIDAGESNNTITFTNNTISGIYDGLFLLGYYGNNTITLTNNNIIGEMIGLALRVSFSNNTIIVINNNISGLLGHGVVLEAFEANNTLLSFVNNKIHGEITGMWTTNLKGLSLLDNNITSNYCGLYFSYYDVGMDNVIIKGNNIIANEIGIMFNSLNNNKNDNNNYNNNFNNNGEVTVTVNYNRIVALIGLYFNANDKGSNFDYNWWGQNDIEDKIIGFTINNHYILKITDLTVGGLSNVDVGDKVSFAFLVLNTTLKNTGVENLAFFTIDGTFNGEAFSTNTNDNFVHAFTVLSEGKQEIFATLDDQDDALNFNVLKKEATEIDNDGRDSDNDNDVEFLNSNRVQKKEADKKFDEEGSETSAKSFAANQDAKSGNDHTQVSALAMKDTGMPIFALLLVLLSFIGVGLFKRQK